MSEKLFGPDRDWQINACLNYTNDAMPLYIQGYKRAADVLTNSVMESNSDLDCLIYPIVFLYRQNLELRLKDTIRCLRYVLDDNHKFPHHHKIKLLWLEVDKLMKRIVAEVDKTVCEYILDIDRDTVESIITEFSNIDPQSIAFRYPGDKTGRNNLPELTHINVRRLVEQMDSLSTSLGKYETVASFIFNWKLQGEDIDRENSE